MELLAVIVALESLTRPGIDVTIYTDSAYVVNSIEKKWVFGWAKKGFAGKKNADLWMRFLNIYKKHNVKMVWVKGHATNAGNNRCDVLATEAADSRKWLEDVGYEKETV